MIISRWRGFEIDSSEGYFVCRREPEHTEEGWSVMLELLRSPLILGRIAFTLWPRLGQEEILPERLKALLGEPRLEESFPDDDFCYLEYEAPIPVFLRIAEQMRDSLGLVRVNFCFKPFSDLPLEELERLRTWFLLPGSVDENPQRAKQRWDALAKVSEKDLGLLGFTENRHADFKSLAFEANFQLDLTRPFWYEVTTSGVDPTLIEYLFLTLMPGFDFKYIFD